eukprot:Protomagalhaensia_sp_Gyna_25__464@NODE_121_length_5100_cov_18_313179_g95_i0_p5_GENE_NODE_121_length_5100_cov_18_313179_g95_i0NODE_121_length_5100_cov_18_313179_g95_i0_p5_ORF_typecomplete_len113_score22_73YTV/PF07639_11/0_0061SecD_SecF/PF02355_16/0_0061_NODE_121_length_5100_cov_18_313179_g95_i0277615
MIATNQNKIIQKHPNRIKTKGAKKNNNLETLLTFKTVNKTLHRTVNKTLHKTVNKSVNQTLHRTVNKTLFLQMPKRIQFHQHLQTIQIQNKRNKEKGQKEKKVLYRLITTIR